ncbi:MAG: Crp/Fnr family transcriptional regulator [Bacteroidota bacterium]
MTLEEQAAILRLSFPFLVKEDVEVFLSFADYQVLQNKESLIQAGKISRKAFFILKGMMRGFFINEKGEEKNIFLRPEHTITGAPDSLFNQSPTKYTFESVTETHLLVFDYEEVLTLGYENSRIIQIFLRSYQENIQTLIYRVESMIDKAPEQRYEALLERSPQFFETAYNKHVANYLGITPVSLSRIIKRRSEA